MGLLLKTIVETAVVVFNTLFCRILNMGSGESLKWKTNIIRE